MKKLILPLVLVLTSLVYYSCKKDETPAIIPDVTSPTDISNIDDILVLNQAKTVIDTLKLSWEASTDDSGTVMYKVVLSMYDDAGALKEIRSDDVKTNRASFVTLDNKKNYQVKITAIDPSSNSSKPVIKDVSGNKEAITHVITDKQVKLSWDKPKNTDDKFSVSLKIYEYTSSKDDMKEVLSVAPGKSEFTFSDYDKLKNYIIKIFVDNETQKWLEEKVLKIYSDNQTNAVTNVKSEKELDPNNIKQINKLKITWEHLASSLAGSTEFIVDLYEVNSTDQSTTKVKTIKTSDKNCEFSDLNNTKSYEVKITATDKAANIETATSLEVSSAIQGIASTVTNSAKNIIFQKILDATNSNEIKDLNLAWEHTPQSSKAIIEYTVNLYMLNAENTYDLIRTVKSDKASHTFSTLNSQKTYKLGIIALNTIATEVYTESEETFLTITPDQVNPKKTTNVTDLTFEKTLDPDNAKIINTLKLNWNHDVESIATVDYTIKLYMYDENGENPKLIRTENSNTTTASFTTLSNTRKYDVYVDAKKSVVSIQFDLSDETKIAIDGLSTTKTSAVSNVQFSKTVNETANTMTMNVSWSHTAQSAIAVMEFTIDLYEYDAAGVPNKTQTIKTANKSYDIQNLDASKAYRIGVIASNISTQEVYIPSDEVVIKAEIIDSSSTKTRAVTDITFNKTLDPSNIKIIDELDIQWVHLSEALTVEYKVELYMFDENGANPKRIRDLTTNSKACLFKTLSNTRTYRIDITATKQVNSGTAFEASDVASKTIVGLQSTKTNAVTNLRFEKQLNTSDSNIIDNLIISWSHTPQSTTAVMEFTIDFYEYDTNGVPNKIRTIKTNNKSYIFTNLNNTKSYRVGVIASNITTQEVYVPSDEVVIRVD